MIVKIKGLGTGGVQGSGVEENRGKGWEETEQEPGAEDSSALAEQRVWDSGGKVRRERKPLLAAALGLRGITDTDLRWRRKRHHQATATKCKGWLWRQGQS